MIKSQFSHLKLIAVVAILAIIFIPSGHPSTAKNLRLPLMPRSVPVFSPPLGIDLSIKEAKSNSLTLNINWYIEQEGLAVQPSQASIIAILIGARGREYKVSSNVALKPDAPRSGTFQVVIHHEEQIVAPQDVRLVITVALKRDGKAGNLPSRTKEFLLHVDPKE